MQAWTGYFRIIFAGLTLWLFALSLLCKYMYHTTAVLLTQDKRQLQSIATT